MIPWTACCNQTWSSSIRIHFLTRAHWHLLPGQIKRRQEAWLCRDAQSGRRSVWDLRAGDDHSTDIVTILVKARIRGGLGQQPAQVPTNIGLWQFVRKLLFHIRLNWNIWRLRSSSHEKLAKKCRKLPVKTVYPCRVSQWQFKKAMLSVLGVTPKKPGLEGPLCSRSRNVLIM